jgi:hypothetical protein
MLTIMLAMGCEVGAADWAMLLEGEPLAVEGGGTLTLGQGLASWYTAPESEAEQVAESVWIDVVGPQSGLLAAGAWEETAGAWLWCVEEIVPAGDGFDLSFCGEVFVVSRAGEGQ